MFVHSPVSGPQPFLHLHGKGCSSNNRSNSFFPTFLKTQKRGKGNTKDVLTKEFFPLQLESYPNVVSRRNLCIIIREKCSDSTPCYLQGLRFPKPAWVLYGENLTGAHHCSWAGSALLCHAHWALKGKPPGYAGVESQRIAGSRGPWSFQINAPFPLLFSVSDSKGPSSE